MLGLTASASGNVKLSQEPLGKGGEGSVYAVDSHSIPGIPPASKLVAKIYHAPEEENRRAKLKAMVTAPVGDDAVAWPQALVFDESKRFLGYIMAKLEKETNREWLYLANAKERNRVAPDFDTRYALAAVRNLAAAVLSVHSAGHKIGDLNESNLFVNASASILIVDSDSMQIADRAGNIYPCVVGKPEYTAPELSYGSFRDNPRTEATDVFAFAVASFQLLTGGATPHQGAFDPNSDDDPLSTVERIRNGVLPALRPREARAYGFTPRPGTPVSAFPAFLTAHLVSFLNPKPELRENESVNLEALIRLIDGYAPTLVRCSRERLHWHPTGEACGWCEAAAESGVDPWGSTVSRNAPAQIALPNIGFSDGSSSPASTSPRRAAPAIAGQQAHAANAGLPSTTGLAGYAPGQGVAANASNAALLQAAAALLGQQAPQQQQTTPAPQRPKKIKGKVVVEYADGSWGVRPPLGVMLRHSPRNFIWAVKEETWSIFKFWWPVERKIASPAALITGVLISLIFVFTNYGIAQSLISANLPKLEALPALIIALIPAATSLFTTLFLLGSGLADRARVKKKHGTLLGFEPEKVPVTILRFIPVSIFYGVPAVVLGTVSGVFTLVRAVVKA